MPDCAHFPDGSPELVKSSSDLKVGAWGPLFGSLLLKAGEGNNRR